MHPIVAEMIAQDHARRMEEYAGARRAGAAARRAPTPRAHPVRRRFADVLVSVAGRLDPPAVQCHHVALPR